jgi:hypothetical protein
MGAEDAGQGEFGMKDGATGRSDMEGKAVRVTATAAGVSEFQLRIRN